WLYRMGGYCVVRDHLLRASAALRGVVAIPQRRLRTRRGADAAGRRRPTSDQAADAALYLVAMAGNRRALAPRCRGQLVLRRCDLVEWDFYGRCDPGLARQRRAQWPTNVCVVAALSVPAFQLLAAPPRARGGAVRATDLEQERQRTIRMRSRALVAVLVGLVFLFYAITIVKMAGSR